MDFLRFLADLRLAPLDLLFQTITVFAQETLVILVICWIFWCHNKKLAYTLGFTYFLSGLLVQGLKITFRIPRPWVLDPTFSPVESAVPGATGYSFPSGHTQSGTALYSTLYLAFRKNSFRIFALFMMLAIGFSRMYLGVHTPKDVLVSMLLTLLISVAIWKNQDLFTGPRAKNGLIAILLAAIAIGLLFVAQILFQNQTLPKTEAEDCFKACGAGLGFAVGFYLERKWIQFSCSGTRSRKMIRFFIGIIVTVILQQGLKPLLGSSLIAGSLRYFIVVLWVLAIYPALFHAMRRRS